MGGEGLGLLGGDGGGGLLATGAGPSSLGGAGGGGSDTMGKGAGFSATGGGRGGLSASLGLLGTSGFCANGGGEPLLVGSGLGFGDGGGLTLGATCGGTFFGTNESKTSSSFSFNISWRFLAHSGRESSLLLLSLVALAVSVMLSILCLLFNAHSGTASPSSFCRFCSSSISSRLMFLRCLALI